MEAFPPPSTRSGAFSLSVGAGWSERESESDPCAAAVAVLGPDRAALATSGGYLFAETGINGTVDEFAVNSDGTLTPIGTVAGLPPGLEGIAAQ